ncbi:putative copper resistance protein D [Jiangella alba]|uniref:Putative copper resistance protein D n=1 Tax=Jiangella alba TaxID=561176 RepID=A0A1H5L2S9_9ACTN|nr:putative copper resistance protein D [Jiangella alba]
MRRVRQLNLEDRPATAAAPDVTGLRLSRRRAPLAAVAVLAAGVAGGPGIAAAVAQDAAVYASIHVDFPGTAVPVTTAVARLVADVAALIAVGGIVVALFLRPRRGGGRDRLSRGLTLTTVQVAALVWLSAAAVSVLAEAADAGGAPLSSAVLPGHLPYLVSFSDLPKAWILTALCAAVVAAGAFLARRWPGLLVPFGAGVLGMLAPVVVGQVLVGPDHDVGVDAAAIQVVLVAATFGPVLVLGLRAATSRVLEHETLRRAARLLATGLPLVLATELAVTWFKLAGSPLLGPGTGRLAVVRLAAVVVVGAALAAAWWWTRRGALTGRRLMWCLATAVVAVAGWLGAGVAMTRIPPPQYFVPTSYAQVFLGFDVDAPPSAAALVTAWRPNVLFAVLAAVAVLIYLLAVRRLRRRGDLWPVGRTAAWTAGWLVVVVVTSSGLGRYSGPSFSVHMGVHMALNMLAPVLLAMGGVTTLLLRAARPAGPRAAAGPHEWLTALLGSGLLRLAYHPLLVFVVFIGSYYGLYLTGLFGDAMRFHWAHQLMNLHFVVVGYLFFSLVVGVDRPPRPLPHLGRLGFVLAAMPFHAFFGVILMNSDTVIAEEYYRLLDLPWIGDLDGVQRTGGGIAWAGGEIPLLLVMSALGLQWARSDEREARRRDRHFDSGLDDDFDSYNEMLRRLGERAARDGKAHP